MGVGRDNFLEKEKQKQFKGSNSDILLNEWKFSLTTRLLD